MQTERGFYRGVLTALLITVGLYLLFAAVCYGALTIAAAIGGAP